MNFATRRALHTLNHHFYRHFSRRFDATREHPWPGWERLLDCCESLAADRDDGPLRILDIGCGNGRFATFVVDRLHPTPRYLGLDGSLPLLAAARRRTRAWPGLRWAAVQLGAEAQTMGLPFRTRTSIPETFDLVVCLAVLHHMPGRRQRAAFVRHLAQRIRPGGLLALSVWRFDQQRGFERKRLPWQEFQQLQALRGEEPIDLNQLEPGDHLLTWDGNRQVPRYCHLPDSEEIDEWVGTLEIVDRYHADGASGTDNLYLLSTRS